MSTPLADSGPSTDTALSDASSDAPSDGLPDAVTPDLTQQADAAAPGASVWTKQFGDTSGEQLITAVETDSKNQVIVAGDFEGSVNLGGGALNSKGGHDIFLAKLAAGGKHVWSKSFGDATAWQNVNGVAVDGVDASIVVGEFKGSINFGGQNLKSAGGTDLFVAKFDKDGKHLWSKRFGDSSDYQIARSVAVDASNNLVVVGKCKGTVNFGGSDLVCASPADLFVAKLSATGAHLWSKKFGGAYLEDANDVAVDGLGNVLVVGLMAGTVNFGGKDLTSAGGSDIFVAKFDKSGKHQWSKRFGNKQTRQVGVAVGSDSGNNMLVVGHFEGTVDVGGGPMVNPASFASKDLFVAKFSPTGTHLWSKHLGDDSPQNVTGMTVDDKDNVILIGNFKGSIDLGGGSLGNAAAYTFFIGKLDSKGKHQWSLAGVGKGDVNGRSVTTDSAGTVIVGGRFWGDINFGGANIKTATGDYDAFLTKFGG